MQIMIKGKQMEVSGRMRKHIGQKLQRLSRMLGDEARVEVTVCEERTRSAQDRFSVQLACSSVPYVPSSIRGAASAVNVHAALDRALDKVTVQLERKKDRSTTKHRLPVSPVKVLALSRAGEVSEMGRQTPAETALNEAENEDIWTQIMEIRRMRAAPMDDQQVIAQMEREHLPFYPFFNAETSSVNVMYRLPGGRGYGLLIPALEQV